MRKRSATLPILAFLVLFVTPIAAVVLLANDARNLRELSRRIGFQDADGASTMPAPTEEPPTSDRPARPQSSEQATTAAPPSIEQQLMEMPQITTDASFRTRDPQVLCEGLGRLAPGVEPQFSAGPGWDCTVLVPGTGSEDVLFLQAKGEGAGQGYGSFRAKISLYDGRAITQMADMAAEGLAMFEPVDRTYVARILTEALAQDQDRDVLLAHGTLVLRKERGEGRRFNVFVRPADAPQAPPTPSSGFTLDTPVGGNRP